VERCQRRHPVIPQLLVLTIAKQEIHQQHASSMRAGFIEAIESKAF
jgi:hypothetical protein